MSTVTAISFKPKATRKGLKKEILSDDFKKRKIFWKNIAEIFLENFPYGKIFHLTSLLSAHCMQANVSPVAWHGMDPTK
jgi:hypothetical protein